MAFQEERLTANHVQSAAGDVRENVELCAYFISQFIDENRALLIEDVHKVVEDLEMKRRCQHLASDLPFFPYQSNQVFNCKPGDAKNTKVIEHDLLNNTFKY